MQVAIRILTNTPVWVFPLLAYLIWQGWQSRRPRTRPIWRMLIVPLLFLLLGLSRLVTARDNGGGTRDRRRVYLFNALMRDEHGEGFTVGAEAYCGAVFAAP